MSTPLRVVVVIPAYKATAFIGRALDSLVAQQRQPDEVFVVVDGSPDETAAVSREWGRLHPGFPLTVMETANGGCGIARNHGILGSTSEVVALLDADDTFHEDHLSRIMAVFHRYPEVGFMFTGMLRRNETTGLSSDLLPLVIEPIMANSKPTELSEVRLLEPGARVPLMSPFVTPPSCWAIRRDLFALVGLFNPRLAAAEDMYQMFRMLGATTTACLCASTGVKFDHDGQMTSPANALRNEKALVQVYTDLQMNTPGLSRAERELLARLLEESLQNLLYAASNGGRRLLAERRAMITGLTGRAPRWSVKNLRHLLRAAVRDLRGTGDGVQR